MADLSHSSCQAVFQSNLRLGFFLHVMSSCSHSSLIGLRPGDCVGHSITVTILADCWYILEVCLWPISCYRMKLAHTVVHQGLPQLFLSSFSDSLCCSLKQVVTSMLKDFKSPHTLFHWIAFLSKHINRLMGLSFWPFWACKQTNNCWCFR